MKNYLKTNRLKNQIEVVFILFFLLIGPIQLYASDVTFSKRWLQIGNEKIRVEIADTEEKTARGLMFRKSLPDGEGMLFVFPDEQVRSFWMKNTFIPLDIGYFDREKKLIDIQQMEPVKTELQVEITTYPSKGPAMYALEVPKGWFSRKKIRLKERFYLK